MQALTHLRRLVCAHLAPMVRFHPLVPQSVQLVPLENMQTQKMMISASCVPLASTRIRRDLHPASTAPLDPLLEAKARSSAPLVSQDSMLLVPQSAVYALLDTTLRHKHHPVLPVPQVNSAKLNPPCVRLVQPVSIVAMLQQYAKLALWERIVMLGMKCAPIAKQVHTLILKGL